MKLFIITIVASLSSILADPSSHESTSQHRMGTGEKKVGRKVGSLLSKTSKKTKKEKVSGCDSDLIALLSPYPGKTGFGTVTTRFNADGAFLVQLSMDDLDPSCNDTNPCLVAIHEGIDCTNLGANLYQGPTNPWSIGTSSFYTYNQGSTSSAFRIMTGFGCEENNGRVVVVSDSNGGNSACGVLKPEQFPKVLKATMGNYPGYDGPINPSGQVAVTFNYDDSFTFEFDLKNLESNCSNCNMHIHGGTSCNSHEEVGGHGWNQNVVNDLWTKDGGAVYNSNENGEAKSFFNLFNGYGYEENDQHAVIIHAQDGTRVACGILM